MGLGRAGSESGAGRVRRGGRQALWKLKMNHNDLEGCSCSCPTPAAGVREDACHFVIETPLILGHGCVCLCAPHGWENGWS